MMQERGVEVDASIIFRWVQVLCNHRGRPWRYQASPPAYRGFQTTKTAYATIKGFEVMRMIHRRQCILCQPRVAGEIQFVNTLFGRAV